MGRMTHKTRKLSDVFSEDKPKQKRKGRLDKSLELTMDMVEQACEMVSDGNFRMTARDSLGVSKSTWSSWITRGNRERIDFDSGKRSKKTLSAKYYLVAGLDIAEGTAHKLILYDVVHCDDPRVKMRFLERRFSKQYNASPNSIDDGTGEETRLSAVEILTDKLLGFVED
jgi:hypothetical protein